MTPSWRELLDRIKWLAYHRYRDARRTWRHRRFAKRASKRPTIWHTSIGAEMRANVAELAWFQGTALARQQAGEAARAQCQMQQQLLGAAQQQYGNSIEAKNYYATVNTQLQNAQNPYDWWHQSLGGPLS